MDDWALKVENVSKKYSKSLKFSMSYGIKDILKNTFGLSSNPSELRKGEFWALKDISFEVKKGQTLGVIGANGAGKTTLLKLLNGIFWPDKGRVSISNKVGALIEVGAGFHPLLSGRENIFINGAILGMGKQDVEEKFDSIVGFADIGDFLDTPVKFYSSGMFVRLGFSVAVHCKPEVLLIDEVLAVGDIAFQNKCFEKIQFLKNEGTTIILISHDLHKIIHHADSAIMLCSGEVKAAGDPFDVVKKFKELMSEQIVKASIVDMPKAVERFGSQDAKIISAKLYDEFNNETTCIKTASKATLKAKIKFYKDVEDPIIGFILNNEKGIQVHNIHTFQHGRKAGKIEAGQVVSVDFCFTANLLPGVYSITAAVSYKEGVSFLDYRNDMVNFSVQGDSKEEGIAFLNGMIKLEKEQSGWE